MIAALIAKDLREHAVFGALSALVAGALAMTVLAYMVSHSSPMLLESVHISLRDTLPIGAAIAAHRLFGLEHRSHTADLLASLPIAPLHIAAAKIVLGAFALLLPAMALLTLAALLLRPIEYIGADDLLLALGQCAVHAFAWWGIAVFGAQLGRHQLTWFGALIILSTFISERDLPDQLDPLQNAFAVGFSEARIDVPWVGIAWGTFIGAISAIAGALVYAARGGATVRALYQAKPNTSRVLVLLTLLLFVVTKSETPRVTTEDRAEGAIIRVRAAPNTRLIAIGVKLDAHLRRFAEHYGLDPFSSWVLAPHLGEPQRAVEIDRHASPRTLFAKRDAPEDEIHRVALQLALAERSYDELDERASWLTRGLPMFWLARQGAETQRWERWAALAKTTTISEDALLHDFPSIALRLGVDLSSAIAWQGVEALARRCGDPAFHALVLHRLGRARSTRPWVQAFERLALSERGDPSDCSLSDPALAQDWRERLERLEAPESEFDLAALQRTEIARGGWPEDLRLSITAERSLPEDAELWWAPADALTRVLPAESHDVVLLREETGPAITLPIDPRLPVRATVAVWSESLGVWTISGWRSLPR